jgi:hypothetical protein
MPDNNELLTELREIKEHLHEMNRRDRVRTIGGTIRGLIMLIPTVLIIWSAWYFYENSGDILKSIAATAAEQATKYSQGNIDKLLNDQLNKLRDGGNMGTQQ